MTKLEELKAAAYDAYRAACHAALAAAWDAYKAELKKTKEQTKVVE